MLNVVYSGQFKKDFKRCQKRGLNIDLLKGVVAILAVPAALPPKNRDHTGQEPIQICLMSESVIINRHIFAAG